MVTVKIFSVEFSLVAIIAAGAGVAVAVGLILIGCLYYCCCYSKRNRTVPASPGKKVPETPLNKKGSVSSSSRQKSQAGRKTQSSGFNSEAATEVFSGAIRPPPLPPVSPARSLGSPVTDGPVAKWEEDLRAALFRKMSLEEVRAATGYFNRKNFVGEGAFAVVFKGKGPSGVPWAVKRSKRTLTEGSAGALDFENEVLMISRLSHKNLVRLLGYCTEQGEHILVYEFAENGSLGAALGRSLPELPFRRRLEIAIGTAEGLHYLHTAATPPIVHRDIKPDNILLDRTLTAKVGDFGLLKHLMDGAQEESVYTRIAGTPGYLDPDYHLTSKITTKGDVYSFGVVLLELCTGHRAIMQIEPSGSDVSTGSVRRPGADSAAGGTTPQRGRSPGRGIGDSGSGRGSMRSRDCDAGPVHISQWVAPYVSAKVVEPIADSRFGNDYNKPALFRMLEIGLLCTNTSSRKRPDMGAVVRWLHEVQEKLQRLEELDAGGDQEEEGEGHYSSVFDLPMKADDTRVQGHVSITMSSSLQSEMSPSIPQPVAPEP